MFEYETNIYFFEEILNQNWTLGGVVGKSSLKMICPCNWIKLKIELNRIAHNVYYLPCRALPPKESPSFQGCRTPKASGSWYHQHSSSAWHKQVNPRNQSPQTSPSNEAKRVILSPAFPLFRQPGLGNSRHLSEIGLALKNMKLENECFKMHRFECMFDGLPCCINWGFRWYQNGA